MAKLLSDADFRTLSEMARWWRSFRPGQGRSFASAATVVRSQPASDRRIAPSSLRVVKVDSNRTGGGKYKGYLADLTTSGTLSLTGDLAEADIGTANTSVEITLINPQETGKSTHALTAGTPVCRFFLAYPQGRLDSNGKPVYVIWGIDLKACT